MSSTGSEPDLLLPEREETGPVHNRTTSQPVSRRSVHGHSRSKDSFEFTAESPDETLMRLSNDLQPIVENGGDTLIYIGVPIKLDSQTEAEYQQIVQQFKKPFLLKSSRLRALQSSKFDKFLGPMSARTERRLKKLGVHRFFPGVNIEYYIDLSPALNDEEALIQLTDLSVPQSALRWHETAAKLNVPPGHVNGRDDLSFVPTLTLKQISTTNTDSDEAEREAVPLGGARQQPSPSMVPKEKTPEPAATPAKPLPIEEEYSTLRHHTALARLLYAIAGQNPKLNSAAKMWAFCMIAKYYEVASHHDIINWISSWLLENGNCHFIQYLPDVSYQIASAIEAQWLMKCTFTILVGQQALVDNLPLELRKDQPHAAKLLDDDDINRVDHASAALAARIKSSFEALVVHPGLWNISCGENSELYKLLNFPREFAGCRTLVQEVHELLRHYIQRMIFMTLSHQYDHSLQQSVPPFPGFREYNKYVDVPRPLRPLTQQFWHILRLEDLSRDYADTDKNKEIWQWTHESLREEHVIGGDEIPYVSRNQLVIAIEKLNDLCLTSNLHDAATNGGNPSKRAKTSQLQVDKAVQTQPQFSASPLPIRNKQSAATMTGNNAFASDSEPSEEPVPAVQPATPRKQTLTAAQGTAGLPLSPSSDMASLSLMDEVMSVDSFDMVEDPEAQVEALDNSYQQQLLQDQQPVLNATETDAGVSPTTTPNPDTYDVPNTFVGLENPQFRKENPNDWRIVPRFLLQELQVYLYEYLDSMIQPGYVVDRTCDFDIPTGQICTMLCLGEGEYKYLPLWAGGLDDGSGGVFNDGVEPPDAPEVAQGGFRGGAMGIIPGVGSVTDSSVSGAGSEFEDVGTESGISTVGKASRWATDGTATETVMSLDD